LHDDIHADQDYQRALELVGNETERDYLIRGRQQLTQ
jgi:predicted RNA polymerase sigma factor